MTNEPNAPDRRTDPVIVVLNCEAQPSIDTAEIDRAEWDAMTPEQRAVEVQTLAAEHMNNSGGYGWHIADEADAAMVGNPTADNAERIPTGLENALAEILTAVNNIDSVGAYDDYDDCSADELHTHGELNQIRALITEIRVRNNLPVVTE